ncbi:MAG TPA: MFS transporter [Candidatus Acidoferrum sp.]|nr:MFS transporter [Candidatus Acidoferrum sp.]
MAEVAISRAERWRGVAAATGCISIVGLMTGLVWPLLALRLDAQGVPSRLIGLNSSVHALAIVAGSLVAPRLVGRLGLVNTLYACIAAAVAALLLLPLFPNVYAWFPIRFALGAATSTIFVAGETWIIHVAPPERRGRIVGIFGFVWAACFAAGPLVIGLTGIAGWTPFVVAVGIALLGALPLPLAQGGAISLAPVGRIDIRRLIRAGPATLLAVFLLAVFDSVNDSFLPLYGLRSGLGEPAAVTVLTVVLAGTTVVQVPIGWLADHVDRRRLLIAIPMGSVLMLALLPFAIASPWLLWPVALLYGCTIGSLWAVSLILVGERYRGADVAAANMARGVLYGLGAFAGPALAGFAFELWMPHGALAVIALVALLFLPVAVFGERDRPQMQA